MFTWIRIHLLIRIPVIIGTIDSSELEVSHVNNYLSRPPIILLHAASHVNARCLFRRHLPNVILNAIARVHVLEMVPYNQCQANHLKCGNRNSWLMDGLQINREQDCLFIIDIHQHGCYYLSFRIRLLCWLLGGEWGIMQRAMGARMEQRHVLGGDVSGESGPIIN
jgi:hypothetical protein